MLAVGDVDAVREEKVDAQQHVRFIQLDVADPEPGLRCRFIPDRETLHRCDPAIDGAMADSVDVTAGGDTWIGSLQPCPRGRPGREDGAPGAGVEDYVDGGSVDLRDPADVKRCEPDRVDVDDRVGLPFRPVGHHGFLAAFRLKQPDHAVGQIVFRVLGAEDVLAEQPVVSADPVGNQKVDVRKVRSRHAELLDRGDLDVGDPANTAQAHSVWRCTGLQAELLDGGRAQGAEEGAAVGFQGRVSAIDLRRDHGRRALEGRGELRIAVDLARRVSRRETGQRPQHRNTQAERAPTHGRRLGREPPIREEAPRACA